MRNLLALLGLVVVSVVGLGWYLDWYKVKTAPSVDGHRSINIDVNTPKIREDLKKGKEQIRDYIAKDNDGNPPPPSFPNIPIPVPNNNNNPTTNTGPIFPTGGISVDNDRIVFPPFEVPIPPSVKVPQLPPPQ